jgi:hypothetical protein
VTKLIAKALSVVFPPKVSGRIPLEDVPVVRYVADPFDGPVNESGIVGKPVVRWYRDGIDKARKMALAESIAAFESWQNS